MSLGGRKTQLAPVAFTEFDAEPFSGSLYTLPSLIPLRVAHTQDLVKARDRVAEVGCNFNGLLTLPGKGKLPYWQVVALLMT